VSASINRTEAELGQVHMCATRPETWTVAIGVAMSFLDGE